MKWVLHVGVPALIVSLSIMLWISAAEAGKLRASRDEWRDLAFEAVKAAKDCQDLGGFRPSSRRPGNI